MTKSPLFSKFDRIRIINLESRTDRRAEMERELTKVGILNDSRVDFFPAIRGPGPGLFGSGGAHGGYLSYLHLLNEAAAAGESILVFEDDCDFILPDILSYSLDSTCDVFYGGYVAKDPKNLHESDIIGAHFMGFSARAAQSAAAYFTNLLDPKFPPDARAAAEIGFDPARRPGVDGALVWFRRAHPEMLTVFALLGFQRASRSDIGVQRFFDRVPGLRAIVGRARRIRDALRGQKQTMKPKNVDFGMRDLN